MYVYTCTCMYNGECDSQLWIGCQPQEEKNETAVLEDFLDESGPMKNILMCTIIYSYTGSPDTYIYSTAPLV